MCQQCLAGEQIDYENLRTPEQQDLMAGLFHPILTGLQQGTTPFPGQLSAPMVDMQKMAAKTMANQGGFGWEQQNPRYRAVPDRYNPTNPGLPVRGGGVTPPGPGPTPPGPTPPGPDPIPPGPGPNPPGPGPDPYDPDPDKPVVDAMLAQRILQSLFNFDPRNTRQG